MEFIIDGGKTRIVVLINGQDSQEDFGLEFFHFGSLNGGHYVAICTTKDGNILYDDMNVSNIDTNQNNFKDKNVNAYMIVYTKKKKQ